MRIAFGLDMRAPSDAEAKLAKQCVLEWKMERALLKKAYDNCVDSIGRYKSSYIKTILTSWHKKGVKKVSDLEKLTDDKKSTQRSLGQSKKYTYNTVDMSLMDKIINED
jgi:DnaD/phage-associated family protein